MGCGSSQVASIFGKSGQAKKTSEQTANTTKQPNNECPCEIQNRDLNETSQPTTDVTDNKTTIQTTLDDQTEDKAECNNSSTELQVQLPLIVAISPSLGIIENSLVDQTQGTEANGGISSFPTIKSTHSLVAKHVTKEKWDKYHEHKTATSGFTLAKAIACAVEFDNQHCGIYAGDWDSYKDFADVFDPIIQEYHGIKADAKHTSDMDFSKITGNVNPAAPVHSTRIRVGRSIDGFGLSPGITQEQRVAVEKLFKAASAKFEGDLAGDYYPLTGMEETVRKQLVDDHFLFMSGDPNLQVSGMERNWPEGRGIFHNKEKTFLVWVNEEDQLRIISMQKGGDVLGVFKRLARGINAVANSVKEESGKGFMLDEKYGYVHSCPTNLGTGMRASVHIDLPGWTKHGVDKLKARCEELSLQPRGTRGESGGQTGCTYDISNKHRLGYSEVQLVQTMIDGVNKLYAEDLELQKQ